MLTTQAGSIVNATGSAIASVYSQANDDTMLVTSFGGPQVIVPMLNDGQGDFTLMNAADAYDAFNGIAPAYPEAYKNLRLVGIGFTNKVGIIVKDDSDIASAADVAGKRVSGSFSQQKTCKKLTDALLANIGLSEDDVTNVPVTSSVPAVKALADGRAEVATCIVPNMAIVQETHVRTPIRFIGIDNSPEAIERARKVFPAGRPVEVKAGSADGVTEDIYLWGYPFYLVTYAGEDDQLVYDVLETITGKVDDLRGIHPAFKSWNVDAMADADINLPFHPGAIRYFKEKGVWTDEMQAASDALQSN